MKEKFYIGSGFYDKNNKKKVYFSEILDSMSGVYEESSSRFKGGVSSTPYNEKSYIRYPFAGDNFELHIEGGNTLPGKYVTLGIRNKSDTPKIFSYAFKIDGSSTRSEKVKTLLPNEIMYTPLSVQCDPDWLNTGFIADISSGTISTFSLYISGRQNESMTDSIMGVKIVSLS